MVRAQAWRLRCEVRGDVIDFPYKPPQHNETIDVFYIKKKDPIMTARCGRFNEQPPRKVMLLDWEKSVFAFGLVRPKDRPRNEGRNTHWTSCAAVDAFVDLTLPPPPIPSRNRRETILRTWCATISNGRSYKARIFRRMSKITNSDH